MTLTQTEEISLITESREMAMKNASQYRAMAALCRQQAAYNPDKSWHLLGQAERWEHLAEAVISEHFMDCNANSSNAQTANGLAA